MLFKEVQSEPNHEGLASDLLELAFYGRRTVGPEFGGEALAHSHEQRRLACALADRNNAIAVGPFR
jgi:hypothetical protein